MNGPNFAPFSPLERLDDAAGKWNEETVFQIVHFIKYKFCLYILHFAYIFLLFPNIFLTLLGRMMYYNVTIHNGIKFLAWNIWWWDAIAQFSIDIVF